MAIKVNELGKRIIAEIVPIKDQKLVKLILKRCDEVWETALYEHFFRKIRFMKRN